MEDKHDSGSPIQISSKWFNLFSWIFIGVIVLFTFLDPMVKVKVVQDMLDAKWLHRGSILMTLIVGYFFLIERFRYLIGLRDSNKGYEKGRKAERKSIIDLLKKDERDRLPRDELVRKLEEEDPDP